MSAPPSLPPGSASRLDAQHPWPGLGSYDEQGSEFFSGRHAEALDLAQMIRLWGAVVLSGESGLGKTSLLRAGVFPRLWELNFFPVYIRLLHATDAPPYGAQVIDRVLEECRNRPDMDPPVLPEPGESLWQWLHREDVEFWNSRNQLMTPVLVFDQFEEIFTRGAESGRRSETDAFFTELADIAENRRPDELPRGCSDAQNYRVVLSLRKEYLSELEVCLGPRMPSALQNRFHLAPLTLDAALEVVRRPAEPGNLLENGAEMAIVAAVSGLRINRQIGGTLSAPEIEGNSRIEPALLCLLCSELNSERLRLGQDRITTSLVEARGGDIIEGFYERALADFPVEVQRMVESLVTPNGQRLSRAEEEVLAMPGISAEVIRELTENDRKRLLRRDRGLGGLPTLELVHDCLAPIVARHREERHRQDLGRERRIKQLKTIATIMGVLAVGALGTGLTVAWTQANAARKARDLSQQRLRQSAVTDDLIAAEKATRRDPESSAYLARALENDPAFERARERAVESLLHGLPAPELLWSSPGMRHGPWTDGDRLLHVNSAGDLIIQSGNGKAPVVHKLGPDVVTVEASSDSQKIVWVSRMDGDPQPRQDRNNAVKEDPSSPTQELRQPQIEDGRAADPKSEDDALSATDDSTGKGKGGRVEADRNRYRLSLLNLKDNQRVLGPILKSEPRAICPNADGNRILFLTREGILKIWDGKPDGLIKTVFDEEGIRANLIRPSSIGGWRAMGSADGRPVLITIPENEAATHTTLAYAQPIVDFLESSGGTRIMARDEEGKVMLFNSRGFLVRSIQTQGRVRIMGMDPMGLTSITVNDANLAEFWSVLDGEPCRPARVLSQASRPVRLLDQGRYLIAAESDGSIYRYQSGWNPGSADSKEIARFGAESNDIFLLPSSPLGKVLAVATDDHRIHFLDPETGDPRRESLKLGGEPIPLIPLPGNDRLLAGGGSSVWLVPVSADEEPQEFKLQPDSALSHSVVDLVVSSDTRAFHVLTDTGVLETHWLDDSKSGAKSREFQDENGRRLIISPAGVEPWLAMTTHLPSQRQWQLRVFRMENDVPGETFVEWTSNSEIWTIVSDRGGRWLAALTWDGTISVFDLTSDDPANEGRRTLALGSSAYHAAFLEGGDRPVLVTGDSQGQLSRWDVIDAKARRDEFVNPCPETVTSLTLSPSGKWLACTTFLGRAVIWDTSTGFAKVLPITHAARIWNFAFDESTDPVRVYTCSRDGHIKVTALETGITHDEADAKHFARLLQWQSGQLISDDGRATRLSPAERRSRLEETSEGSASPLQLWSSSPAWTRGAHPDAAADATQTLTVSNWEDRRFPSPWRHAYDRDPQDPLAALALAAWLQNFDHAKWLAEQAIPRLADDEITITRAIQYLNDAGLSSEALKLIAKWTPEKTALASALEASRACSLSDNREQARKWLEPHLDTLSKDRHELARLIIECFRAGADSEGLKVFAHFKQAHPSAAGNSTEAWATLAAGLVGHAQGDESSLERVREASLWFEQNSGTYGWKREGHFGWATASQFLRDQGEETTLAPVDIYRFALGENDLPFAHAAYEKIDPFSKLIDAIAKAESTPELDSADLYLGRILHQWFSGDVEGARVSWKMLLEFDDQFDDPEFRAGLQLWPYELQAIEKISAGKDNWMEEVEIPDDTQEWDAAGMPDPEIMADLTGDTSEHTLAGRILHLSMLGDQLNAVATARLLLMRNPAWAETRYLEAEGWDPEEIALFLSAIDQAQSTPSSR